jgi:hypothetical protein
MAEKRTPWHHWPIALFSLLFYAAGTVDFTLTKLRLEFYVKRFTTEQFDYFTMLPDWITALWALAAWGGLIGAWLLWRRNRFSVLLLFLAFAALMFLTIWLTLFTRPTLVGVGGFVSLYLLAGSCALAFLIYVYARWERTERWLR